MLRTCNALRIAGLPVLRNDGRGKPCLRPAPCADVTPAPCAAYPPS
ncbi:MAG: hypothetical protein LBM98_01710 [Oscillospiraceae bacterium]|nr:hypothetical protein [Oscillospiraceae bacterium]